MKRLLLYLTCIFNLLILSLHASDSIDSSDFTDLSSPLSKTRFDVGYAVGRYIGLREDYVELGTFVPLVSICNCLTFADVRGYWFNNGPLECGCQHNRSRWGASAGVGLRMEGCDERIWGGNIYYDCLQSHFHGCFQRIGLGVEWLGPCWDFRLNGYIPVDFQQQKNCITDSNYTGVAFASVTQEEFALSSGVDAELGFPLPNIGCFNFYGAFGFYSFHNPNVDSFTGGQIRFEIDWQSLVALQVRTSYDSENHACAQAEIQLNIPLELLFNCSGCWDYCVNSFYRPVRRNGIIFTEQCCIYMTNF